LSWSFTPSLHDALPIFFIFLAPLLGLVIGLAVAVAVAWAFRRTAPRRVDKIFRRGQLLSAAFYSLGHGGNDAQKTMGIIFVLLIDRKSTRLNSSHGSIS